MPIRYVRSLTSHERTARSDRHLGFALAFVAGAANAGAFLAVHLYTSHMTGIVSSLAEHVAFREYGLALGAVGAVLSFLLGAACCSVMVNYARRRGLRSRYALPLVLEAALFLVFGLLGGRLAGLPGLFVPATVMLLCFMMGLQNAVITKVSGAVVRTTHLTGVITDLGIELGKLVFWNRDRSAHLGVVRADRERMATLAGLFAFFLTGGILGTVGFQRIGYLATVPLAVLLLALASVPVVDDVLARFRGASAS